MRQISSGKKQQAARSPGKLILSGEHSVVYGAPALVAAVNRYTEVWFTPIHRSRTLQTAFENLSKGEIYPLDAVSHIKQKLDERFDAFAQGKIPVHKILQRPDDLAIYALAQVVQSIPMPGITSTRQFPIPGRLSSRSDLPLGAGMGSSAAIIAATLILYEHFLGKQQSAQKRFEWTRFCERLQHGKGSAVDAAAVTYGGLNKVVGSEVSRSFAPDGEQPDLGDGWYWVLSGIPTVSTGECVADVRRKFGKDSALWQEFADCTNQLEANLFASDSPLETIRQNHRLLDHIGVVTEPVNQFIQGVEDIGGASKISGAGAIAGENSGVVLVHLDDPEAMKRLMVSYPDWEWDRLSIATQGAELFHRPMTAREKQEAWLSGGTDNPIPAH